MNTHFDKPYDPKTTEDAVYRLWEESGYFNPDRLPPVSADLRRKLRRPTQKVQRKSAPALNTIEGSSPRESAYCIVIPPPNVTGSLHMGHALNATIQDILIRMKRMQGYAALWVPGTDHAGIATQNVVEKKLKKENLTRFKLGREEFIKRVWEWKEQYGTIILDQLRKLGASCDWSRTAFTLDAHYTKAVQAAFFHYYKKGLIYSGKRVVNWCTRCGTSLSDLEVEHQEVQGTLWYIKYPLKTQTHAEHTQKNPKQQQAVYGAGADNPRTSASSQRESAFITVATTRPETMLGDVAVAVHPQDKRYKVLVGHKVHLPLTNRTIPLLADAAIEKEFGTGAVKVTPAHDLLDAEIAERHKLPYYSIIDARGKMTREAGNTYEGLSVKEARERVLEELKKLHLLEREESYTHSVSTCYRCYGVLEPQLSDQWFLKMNALSKQAIRAATSGGVKFHPKRWEKVYLTWLRNVKDWCISRQIWWGHRLPVYFCKNKREGISKQFSQPQNLKKQAFVVASERPNICPFCKRCTMVQADDVLDTWFSSALWPFAVLGWPDVTQKEKREKGNVAIKSDFERFYPTQVLSTARDIMHFWVARMVFSALEFTRKVPFRDVIIHPTVLTRDGRRMSKSLGTGVDPMDLIAKYGADATRFGLIWQMMGGQDLHFASEHIVAGKKFANKFWNITRYVLLKTDGMAMVRKRPFAKDTQSKAFLAKLSRVAKGVEKDIEAYRFGHALRMLYDFVWHDFADRYLEYSKEKDDDETKRVLSYALWSVLKLLHPFMPFITEAIYQRLPLKEKSLLMVEVW